VAFRGRRGYGYQHHARLTKAGVVTHDDLLDDIAEVLDDVEAVGNLQRVGCAPSRPLLRMEDKSCRCGKVHLPLCRRERER